MKSLNSGWKVNTCAENLVIDIMSTLSTLVAQEVVKTTSVATNDDTVDGSAILNFQYGDFTSRCDAVQNTALDLANKEQGYQVTIVRENKSNTV